MSCFESRIPSLTRTRFNEAQAILRGSGRLLTHPRIDIHIHPSSLIRYDRKWLRFGTNVTVFATLHIQNVIARRQRNSIISLSVRRDTRDFSLSSLTPDHKWIVRIVLSRAGRRARLGQLNFLRREHFQMSLEKTRQWTAVSLSAAEQ